MKKEQVISRTDRKAITNKIVEIAEASDAVPTGESEMLRSVLSYYSMEKLRSIADAAKFFLDTIHANDGSPIWQSRIDKSFELFHQSLYS